MDSQVDFPRKLKGEHTQASIPAQRYGGRGGERKQDWLEETSCNTSMFEENYWELRCKIHVYLCVYSHWWHLRNGAWLGKKLSSWRQSVSIGWAVKGRQLRSVCQDAATIIHHLEKTKKVVFTNVCGIHLKTGKESLMSGPAMLQAPIHSTGR